MLNMKGGYFVEFKYKICLRYFTLLLFPPCVAIHSFKAFSE